MREIIAVFITLLAFSLPGIAQDDPAPWQVTVSGQIEAFRAGDGARALTFAGAGFRTQFEAQPDAFYAAIIASGYAPIARSRSHSFGVYRRISDTSVTQVVTFIGSDQKLYEALYQLTNEDDTGWRVQGVILRREAGVGV